MDKVDDCFFEVYDLYRRPGIEPVLKKFCERAIAELDRQTMAHGLGGRHRSKHKKYILRNATYWFEHELRQ